MDNTEKLLIEIIEQCVTEAITPRHSVVYQQDAPYHAIQKMDWSTADLRKHREVYQSNWFELDSWG